MKWSLGSFFVQIDFQQFSRAVRLSFRKQFHQLKDFWPIKSHQISAGLCRAFIFPRVKFPPKRGSNQQLLFLLMVSDAKRENSFGFTLILCQTSCSPVDYFVFWHDGYDLSVKSNSAPQN